MHGQVYSVTDDGDLPLAGMDTDGCHHTACPISANGNRATYSYTLPLAKKFPVVSFVASISHSFANFLFSFQTYLFR